VTSQHVCWKNRDESQIQIRCSRNWSTVGDVSCNWCKVEQSSPSIVYVPRTDATLEAEVSALAAVYQLVLSERTRGRLLDESGPDDARKDQDAGTYPHCT
jgi:hypothetical protein